MPYDINFVGFDIDTADEIVSNDWNLFTFFVTHEGEDINPSDFTFTNISEANGLINFDANDFEIVQDGPDGQTETGFVVRLTQSGADKILALMYSGDFDITINFGITFNAPDGPHVLNYDLFIADNVSAPDPTVEVLNHLTDVEHAEAVEMILGVSTDKLFEIKVTDNNPSTPITDLIFDIVLEFGEYSLTLDDNNFQVQTSINGNEITYSVIPKTSMLVALHQQLLANNDYDINFVLRVDVQDSAGGNVVSSTSMPIRYYNNDYNDDFTFEVLENPGSEDDGYFYTIDEADSFKFITEVIVTDADLLNSNEDITFTLDGMTVVSGDPSIDFSWFQISNNPNQQIGDQEYNELTLTGSTAQAALQAYMNGLTQDTVVQFTATATDIVGHSQTITWQVTFVAPNASSGDLTCVDFFFGTDGPDGAFYPDIDSNDDDMMYESNLSLVAPTSLGVFSALNISGVGDLDATITYMDDNQTQQTLSIAGGDLMFQHLTGDNYLLFLMPQGANKMANDLNMVGSSRIINVEVTIPATGDTAGGVFEFMPIDSGMPGINDIEMLYGFDGDDSNFPNDPDGNEDAAFFHMDPIPNGTIPLATFESSDSLANFSAQITFDTANGPVNLSLVIAHISGTHFEVRIHPVTLEMLQNQILTNGLNPADVSIILTDIAGGNTEVLDFHYIDDSNGGGGGVTGIHLYYANYDLDGADVNSEILEQGDDPALYSDDITPNIELGVFVGTGLVNNFVSQLTVDVSVTNVSGSSNITLTSAHFDVIPVFIPLESAQIVLTQAGMDYIQANLNQGDIVEVNFNVYLTANPSIQDDITFHMIGGSSGGNGNMPGVNDLDIIYGFVGDDDQGPLPDPDGNEDIELTYDDLANATSDVLLATFTTTDDISTFTGYLGYIYSNGNPVNSGNNLISFVDLGNNTVGVYLVASEIPGLLPNIFSGTTIMEVQITQNGIPSPSEQYPFHFVNNPGGSSATLELWDAFYGQVGQDLANNAEGSGDTTDEDPVVLDDVNTNDLVLGTYKITNIGNYTINGEVTCADAPILDGTNPNGLQYGTDYILVATGNNDIYEIKLTAAGLAKVDQHVNGTDEVNIGFYIWLEDSNGNVVPGASDDYWVEFIQSSGNGSNNPPHIEEGAYDEDGQDNDFTQVTIDEDDVPNFSSIHVITDENAATVELEYSPAFEPILIDSTTNQQYTLSDGVFDVTVNNGILEFSFTAYGISQLGIDQMVSGEVMHFFALYHVVDEMGNISDTHTLSVLINGQGSGGNPPTNNPPIILEGVDDSDNAPNNNTTLINIESSDISAGSSIQTFDVVDESVSTVAMDNASIVLVDNDTGASYSPGLYYTVSMVNGDVSFAFTAAGINAFGLANSNNEKSFTAVFRVVDNQGQFSSLHTFLINVNMNSGNNNPPIIEDEADDEDGITGNDFSVITVEENDINGQVLAHFDITDENVNTVTLVSNSVVMVDNVTGASYNMSTGYFSVVKNGSGQLEFKITDAGKTALGIDQMNAGDTKSYTITMQVKDEVNQTSDIHNLVLNINGNNGGGNPPGPTPTYGLYDAYFGSVGADLYTEIVQDADEAALYLNNLPPQGSLNLATFLASPVTTVTAGFQVAVTVQEAGNPTTMPPFNFVYGTHFKIIPSPTAQHPNMFTIELTQLGADLLESQPAGKTYTIGMKISQNTGTITQPAPIVYIFDYVNANGTPSNNPPIIESELDDEDGLPDNDISLISIMEDEASAFVAEFEIVDENPDTCSVISQSVVMVDAATGASYGLNSGYYEVFMDNGVLKFEFTAAGISALGIDQMTANDSKGYFITMQVRDDVNQTSNIHTLTLKIAGQDGAPGTPPQLIITDDIKAENEAVFANDGVFIEFKIVDDEPGTIITALNLTFLDQLGSEVTVPANMYSYVLNSDGTGYIKLTPQAVQMIQNYVNTDDNNPYNDEMQFFMDITIQDVDGNSVSYENIPAKVIGPTQPPELIITDDEKDENEAVFANDGVFIEFEIVDDKPGTVITNLNLTYINQLGTESTMSPSMYNYVLNSDGTGHIVLTPQGVAFIQAYVDANDNNPDNDEMQFFMDITIEDTDGNSVTYNNIPATVVSQFTGPEFIVTDDSKGEFEQAFAEDGVFIEFEIVDDKPGSTIVSMNLTYINQLGTESTMSPSMYNYVLNSDGTGHIQLTPQGVAFIQAYVNITDNNPDNDVMNFMLDITIQDSDGLQATYNNIPATVVGELPNNAPEINVIDADFEESELPMVFEFSVTDENVSGVTVTGSSVSYNMGQGVVTLDPSQYTVSYDPAGGTGSITITDTALIADLQAMLYDGDVLPLSVMLEVTDEHGATDSVNVTVTINGEGYLDNSAPIIASQTNVSLYSNSLEADEIIFQFNVTDDSNFNVYLDNAILGNNGGPNGQTPPIAPFFYVESNGSAYTVRLTQLGVDTIEQYLQDNAVGEADIYDFVITAVDEFGNTSTHDLNLSVIYELPINTPPAIDLLENMSVMDTINQYDLLAMANGNGEVVIATFEVSDAETDPEDLIVTISGTASSGDNDINLINGIHYVLEGTGATKVLKLTAAGVDELVEEIEDLGGANAVDFSITVSDGIITIPPFEFTLNVEPGLPAVPDSVTADDASIEVPDSPYIPQIMIDLDDFTNDTDPNAQSGNTHLHHSIINNQVTFVHEDGTQELIDIDLSDMFSFDEVSGEFLIDTTNLDVLPGQQVQIIIGHSAVDTMFDGDMDSGLITLTIFDDDII